MTNKNGHSIIKIVKARVQAWGLSSKLNIEPYPKGDTMENLQFNEQLTQPERFELKADVTKAVADLMSNDERFTVIGQTVKGFLVMDKATEGVLEVTAVVKKATKDLSLNEVVADLLDEKQEKDEARVKREAERLAKKEAREKAKAKEKAKAE